MTSRLAVALTFEVVLGACGSGASPNAATPTTGLAGTSTAVGSTGSTAGAGVPDFQAVDACSLLPTPAVAPLVPDPAAQGHENPTPVGTDYVCKWESQSDASLVPPSLELRVSKAPPEPLGLIKQSFTVEAADHNGRVVEGLGDAALVQSVIAGSAEVKVVRRPLLPRP